MLFTAGNKSIFALAKILSKRILIYSTVYSRSWKCVRIDPPHAASWVGGQHTALGDASRKQCHSSRLIDMLSTMSFGSGGDANFLGS